MWMTKQKAYVRRPSLDMMIIDGRLRISLRIFYKVYVLYLP